MAYRDDEIGQLRAQLKDVSGRLATIEEHYNERGFTKTFGRKMVEGLWAGLTWPFRTLWRLVTSGKFWVICFVLAAIALIAFMIHRSNVQEEAQALAEAEEQAEIARQKEAEEQAEREAARQEREAAEQALFDQCATFCRTHGYSFEGERREDMCFCTHDVSGQTAFIINVETSENWTIEAERR